MNSASYNTSCNDEMRWDGDGASGEDDVDDYLDDACDDGNDDDDDLPSGRFSPQRNLPAGDGFSSL